MLLIYDIMQFSDLLLGLYLKINLKPKYRQRTRATIRLFVDCFSLN